MPSPVPGTGIAAVSDSPRSFRLFYQSRGGRIVESRHVGGMWFSNVLSFSPVGGSPLASITYGAGREVSGTPHISLVRSLTGMWVDPRVLP